MDMQGPGLELGKFFSDVQNLLGFGEQKQAAPPPVEVEVEQVTMGVGLILEYSAEGTVRIADMEKFSSAFNNGVICNGDVLFAIDGHGVLGMDMSEIKKLLLGPKGTKVDLSLVRLHGSSARFVENIECTLERIPPRPAAAEKFEDPSNMGITFIRKPDCEVYVSEIQFGSEAFVQKKIAVGDKLWAVDNIRVGGKRLVDILNMLKGTPGNPLPLSFLRNSDQYQVTMTGDRVASNRHRLQPGPLNPEIYLELLEMAVISDVLKKSLVISHCEAGGAADKTTMLAVGDSIMMVNGEVLANLPDDDFSPGYLSDLLQHSGPGGDTGVVVLGIERGEGESFRDAIVSRTLSPEGFEMVAVRRGRVKGASHESHSNLEDPASNIPAPPVLLTERMGAFDDEGERAEAAKLGLVMIERVGTAYLGIEVLAIRKGSPAEACKSVEIGDVLLTVEGESVAGMTLGQVSMILDDGPAGSDVNIGMLRKGRNVQARMERVEDFLGALDNQGLPLVRRMMPVAVKNKPKTDALLDMGKAFVERGLELEEEKRRRLFDQDDDDDREEEEEDGGEGGGFDPASISGEAPLDQAPTLR